MLEYMKMILTKDYYIWNCNKILKLRRNILSVKNKLLRAIKIKLYNKLCFNNSTFIPISAKIGERLCFSHGLNGIFISSGAIIGNDCTIFQSVTIGSNTLEGSKNIGSPIIGNNVYIGAGAKIIGNIKVGNNVRIGANAVVVKDVPDNATVVLDNIKIINHKGSRNNKFININQVKNQNK